VTSHPIWLNMTAAIFLLPVWDWSSDSTDVHLLIFIVEQNLAGIAAVVSTVLCLGIHATHHRAQCVKTRRHPQNRKYITYRNAVRRGLNHDHRHHAHKIGWSSAMRFLRYANGQTDRQSYSSQYFAPEPGEGGSFDVYGAGLLSVVACSCRWSVISCMRWATSTTPTVKDKRPSRCRSLQSTFVHTACGASLRCRAPHATASQRNAPHSVWRKLYYCKALRDITKLPVLGQGAFSMLRNQ